MKTPALIPVSLLLMACLASCEDKIIETRTYITNKPQYLSYEDLRAPVNVLPPQEVNQSGKIYLYNDLILLNEPQKGIHIISRRNSSSPEKICFVEIPGNVDMAVKNGVLYADSYIDLLTFDITNPASAKLISRCEGVFDYRVPEPDYTYPITDVDTAHGIVVGWLQAETTERVDASAGPANFYKYRTFGAAEMDVMYSVNTAVAPSGVSQGGSMARFSLYNNYLYAIHGADLLVFDVSSAEPVYQASTAIAWDIETLFQYQGNMFIGSQTGMYIYSLSDPLTPTYVSTFMHVRRCDPVVVEGHTAYVTLRAGGVCGGFESELDVIDVSDISNPQLIKDYEMSDPYGLGVDGSTLFICDGKDGLKIYDATDPYTIDKHLIKTFPDIHTYDVIPYDGLLIMTGKEGLHLYSYSDRENITLLSTISVRQ